MVFLGQISLYIAFALGITTAVLNFLVLRKKEALLYWARRAFWGFSFSIALAAFSLLYLILTHNFQVAYVYNYSSLSLPLHYLIATFWAGQEGTFLLWILWGTILGLLMMKKSGKFEASNILVLSLINCSILLILLKRGPFNLLPQTPADGVDLNPLLQNFWMVVHPPIMFLGFAATGIVFAFAISALIHRAYHNWTEYASPWILLSWGALGFAMVEGGYWAYEVLGWGGYWAWDPVENSSLIPWLFCTALIHSSILQKRSGALKRTSIFLGGMSFLMVLYGTFLTRSGVLADFSVHSFLEMGINNYLIGMMLFFTSLGGLWFVKRFSESGGEKLDNQILNANTALYSGVLGFTLAAILVWLGTSAPLLTGLFASKASSVSQSYYFITITPIAILWVSLLGALPFLLEIGRDKKYLVQKIVIFAILVGMVVFTIYFAGVRKPLYLILAGVSLLALISNFDVVLQKLKKKKISGAFLAHSGIGLLLIGVIFSSGHEKRTQVNLQAGQPKQVFGYTLTYQGKEQREKDEKTYFKILVQPGDKNDKSFFATPTQHYSPYNQAMMHAPYIRQEFLKDLYFSPLHVEYSSVADEGQILELAVGEEKPAGNFSFRFEDFELTHGSAGPEMVGAVLLVKGNSKAEKIIPKVFFNEKGAPRVQEAFLAGTNISVVIAGVDATSKRVALRVSGIVPAELAEVASENIAIEFSIKPLINLFWLGALVVVSGGIFAFKKRMKKVSALLKTEQILIPQKSSIPETPVSQKV